MAHKSPLSKIKDVAVESLKGPMAAVGPVVERAKEAAAVGLTTGTSIAKSATDRAGDAVTSLVSGLKGSESQADSPLLVEPLSPEKATPEKASAEPGEASAPTPVNVVKDLGLDPAPFEEPQPAEKAPMASPVTKIDAAADASDVHVTPADVADSVAKNAATEN